MFQKSLFYVIDLTQSEQNNFKLSLLRITNNSECSLFDFLLFLPIIFDEKPRKCFVSGNCILHTLLWKMVAVSKLTFLHESIQFNFFVSFSC